MGLFLRLMASDAGWGDTPELLTASYVLGVPHTTGYPFFTMLTKLANFLSIPGFAFGANIIWSLAAALIAVMLYILVLEATGSHLAGAFSALTLVFSRMMIETATVVEVYGFHALLLLTVLVLLMRWRRSENPDARGLLFIGFLISLGLGHHGMFLFVLLAAVYLVLERKPDLAAEVPLLSILGFAVILGSAVFYFLPLSAARAPAWNWGVPDNPRALLDLLTGAGFRKFETDLPLILSSLKSFWIIIAANPIWVLLGLWGFLSLFPRRKDLFITTLFIGLATLVFAAMYMTREKAAFTLPAFVMVLIFAGEGFARLVDSAVKVVEFIANRKKLNQLLKKLPLLIFSILISAVVLAAFLPWLKFGFPRDFLLPVCKFELVIFGLLLGLGALGGIRTHGAGSGKHLTAARIAAFALMLVFLILRNVSFPVFLLLTYFLLRGSWRIVVRTGQWFEGGGFDAMLKGAGTRLGFRGMGAVLGGLVIIGAISVPGIDLARKFPIISTPVTYAQKIFDTQPDDSVFFVEWDGDPYAVFRYAQVVWGIKPGISVVYRFLLGFPWYLKHLDQTARARGNNYFSAMLRSVEENPYKQFDPDGVTRELLEQFLGSKSIFSGNKLISVNFNAVDLEFLTDNFFNSKPADSRVYRFFNDPVSPPFRFVPMNGYFSVFATTSSQWQHEFPVIKIEPRELSEPMTLRSYLIFYTQLGEYYVDMTRRDEAILADIKSWMQKSFRAYTELDETQTMNFPVLSRDMGSLEAMIKFDAVTSLLPSKDYIAARIGEIDNLLTQRGIGENRIRMLLYLESQLQSWINSADRIPVKDNELKDVLGFLLTPEAELGFRLKVASRSLDQLMKTFTKESPKETVGAFMDAAQAVGSWSRQLEGIRELVDDGSITTPEAASRCEIIFNQIRNSLKILSQLHRNLGAYVEREMSAWALKKQNLQDRVDSGEISDGMLKIETRRWEAREQVLIGAEWSLMNLMADIDQLSDQGYMFLAYPLVELPEAVRGTLRDLEEDYQKLDWDNPIRGKLVILTGRIRKIDFYINIWRQIKLNKYILDRVLIPEAQKDGPSWYLNRIFPQVRTGYLNVANDYFSFRTADFLDKAYNAFSDVLTMDPNFSRAKYLRGMLARKLGNNVNSTVDLQRTIDLVEAEQPRTRFDMTRKFFMLSQAYRALGFADRGMEYWTRMARLQNPKAFGSVMETQPSPNNNP